MKCLKFVYHVFSFQKGYSGTDPQQLVIKLGLDEPELVLEAADIPAQFLEKVSSPNCVCLWRVRWTRTRWRVDL